MIKGRVLVVDDDETMLGAVAMLLRDAGYEVFTAANLDDVPGRVRDFAPDIILMDVMMDGEADSLILELRAMDELWNASGQIVFHSGLPGDELRRRAKRAGVANVIPKPASEPAILDCMRRLMQHAAPLLACHNPGVPGSRWP